jgi:hypothetical protein
MSITNQELRQIILEEYKALLLEFNPKALLKTLDDVGDAKTLMKALRRGDKIFSKPQLRQIADAIDNPGIGIANIDPRIVRAYKTQMGHIGGAAKRASKGGGGGYSGGPAAKVAEPAADVVQKGKRAGDSSQKS